MSIEIIQDFLNQVLSWGPEMLLFICLIGQGIVLKMMPGLPNTFIPWINLLVATVAYPIFLADVGRAPPTARYPQVYFVWIGFIIFVAAWIAHNKFLKSLEDKLAEKFPFLGRLFESDSTGKSVNQSPKEP